MGVESKSKGSYNHRISGTEQVTIAVVKKRSERRKHCALAVEEEEEEEEDFA